MNLTQVITLIVSSALIIIGVVFRFKRLKKKANSKADSIEVIEVQLSKNEEPSKDIQASSLSAENMFSALHGLLKSDPDLQENVSFEMVSSGDRGIRFYVAVPSNIQKFVESQIYAQYPSAHINAVTDYTRSLNPQHVDYKVASLSFTKPNYYPIRSFRDLEVDPISSVTSAISSIYKGEEIWLQVMIRPIPDVWQQEGFNFVNKIREGIDPNKKRSIFGSVGEILKKESFEILSGVATGLFTYKEASKDIPKPALAPRLGAAKETELRAIENKLTRMGFETVIRIVVAAPKEDRVATNLRSITAALEQFSTSSLNSFSQEVDVNKERSLNDYISRSFAHNKSFILNTEELATFFHFPLSHIDTPNISWVYSRKSEPPANLPTENCVYLGETLYRNETIRFVIKNDEDRLRHLYVIGKSGTGKSSLFVNMISQDIANGAGLAVFDPHGETIERVLERIPDSRIEDVIYFDPSDTERPIGLNLLEIDDPSQKNIMASGLVSAIKQHFDFSWGPRLEYLLNYAILTLLEVPGTTMLGITRLLEDDNYRKYILHNVKDPVVTRFWEEEFRQMKGNQKLVTEAISPIQNKVNRFLASTTMRNILGQRKSTLDFWGAMNSGKILLMNLAKGKIGSDNANLLGALLVSRIQFYALQRVKIPYDQRTPFYLYVDEFQNFATGSFEEILSESRKYKIGLHLTHQFTGQLPEDLLLAVFGNVGTIMTFALGAPDAKELAKEFAPYFDEEDIISLERFQVYTKLMIDGMTSHPFSAKIILPWDDDFMVPKTPNREKVIQFSREKYGVSREHVEEKINKWVTTKFDKGLAIAQQYSTPDQIPQEGSVKNSQEEK
ncbi:type IV secretion system DNA-binding domain-containing protein [Patescibacteria group bacterium]|nr:type IV secretion system DNA-binding domain-containing protein [Patescibacteria group bacterium]